MTKKQLTRWPKQPIPVAASITLKYVVLFLIPYPLRFYYGYDQVDINDWSTGAGLLSVLILTTILILIIYFWKRRNALTFGLMFFLATMVLYSNLLSPAPGIMAERFVFVPILGLCIAAAFGIKFILDKIQSDSMNKAKLALPGLVIAVFTLMSFNRVPDWNSRMSLYEADIENLEESAKANMMIATEMDRLMRTSKEPKDDKYKMAILGYYQQAINIYPQYKQAYNNMGWVYLNEYGDVPNAFAYFNNAVKIDKNYPEALYGVGICYLRSGDTNNALINLKTAYDQNPKKMMNAIQAICNIYFQLKAGEQLEGMSRMAIADGHEFPGFYIYLGNALYFQGKINEAIVEFETAYEMGKNPNVCADIIKMAEHVGRADIVEKYKKFCEQ